MPRLEAHICAYKHNLNALRERNRLTLYRTARTPHEPLVRPSSSRRTRHERCAPEQLSPFRELYLGNVNVVVRAAMGRRKGHEEVCARLLKGPRGADRLGRAKEVLSIEGSKSWRTSRTNCQFRPVEASNTRGHSLLRNPPQSCQFP